MATLERAMAPKNPGFTAAARRLLRHGRMLGDFDQTVV